jgi:hypothetical protein
MTVFGERAFKILIHAIVRLSLCCFQESVSPVNRILT